MVGSSAEVLDPTPIPSVSPPSAIAQIEFDAVFTLMGLSLDDVPVDADERLKFEESLITSNKKTLPPSAKNVEVEVTSIGGDDEGATEIGFRVVATKDCEDDCEDPAALDAVLVGYQDAFTKAVATGDLTEIIRAEASSPGVPQLEKAATVPE
jgi:hypothetical protein